MKILELRFKNLNSLYGEWHIDFTDSEYVYNGIFALTGPTGAGKSTILDAICLALYGSTPRLGRITQSSNDIMSRQTGECYAEVVFASQAGRYRCHWGQHRSRKKADGELQSPRHEIAEATAEGKVLENKLTSVLIAVEEKTGMDFDRFTRSILLAQGGFDTFLKATIEQKSRILEQITGTKIYSDISIGVHERLKKEESTRANLEAEIGGIPILTVQEEQAAQEELAALQQQEAEVTNLVTDLSKSITWLQGIHQLEKEISDLSGEETHLVSALQDFAPKRQALDEALKAATLEGVYATLSALRIQQTEDQTSREKEEATLPALESEAEEGSARLVQAENVTILARTAQKEAIPLLKQVRALDQILAQLTVSITESKNTIATHKETSKTHKTKRDLETKKEALELKKLSEIEAYCTEHAHDKALVTELTGLSEQIQALASKQKEVGKQEVEVKKAARALKAASEALAACNKLSLQKRTKHEKAKGDLEGKKEELSRVLGDKLLREYRSEKDVLLREREYLARIAALEEHRNHLEEGRPCPLCGSIEHPFALGTIPTHDETDKQIDTLTKIISDAETLETSIQHLIQAERDASTALTEQEKLESDALHAEERSRTTHKMSVDALSDAQSMGEAMAKGLVDRLKAYEIQEIPDDLSSLLASLRERKDAWLKQEADKRAIENVLSTIKGELQRLDGVIETEKRALQEKEDSLRVLLDAFAKTEGERMNLFGDKDADKEEDRLSSAVHSAETAEKKASKESADLLQKVRTAKDRIESFETSLGKRRPLLETKESLFLEELSSIGFTDERQFLSSTLSLSDRNRLAQEAKTLDDRQTELKANQRDRTTRLGIELGKALTEKNLVELEPLFAEKEDELKVVRDTVAEHKAKLKGNVAAKQQIASKQEALEKRRKECSKWDRLHSLIGSADGKKFRNFAQGLTFELMVGHANRQLERMSDRYLLIRSAEQPLELNVIDNYQAGEIRSTKNLSGGESFIVSLTLALGLSKMASRKVRVDSLFLDEGFGTLDEASLETALKTLSSLHQDGKLIGVISHVSAMQDLISTQIVITPASGGKSLLTGPGCSRVD